MQLLDTVKLQTFLTITQTGSFTNAAQQLSLTQPTVSQQIAILEKTIGTSLFIRQPRHLELTAAGTTLLSYAERILLLGEEAIHATLEAANLAQRTLRIGVGHTLAIYLLPDLLSQLRHQQPDLEIRIRAGNTTDLLTATAEGQVELALVGSPAVHPALTINPFMNDELVVIISQNDPWMGLSSVTLDDLRQRTLLTRENGSALHASVQDVLGVEHLQSSQVIILGETEAIKRSVEAELGVALIQGIAVRRELAQEILHTVPLRDTTIKRTYNIAWRRNHPLSPVGELMCSLLGVTR